MYTTNLLPADLLQAASWSEMQQQWNVFQCHCYVTYLYNTAKMQVYSVPSTSVHFWIIPHGTRGAT